MARSTAYRPRVFSAADQHRAWLELVDTEGPFLAIPPLKRVWPQGMPALTGARKTALIDARKDFESAWERLDRLPGSETALEAYRVERDKWVESILRDVAGWGESLAWGEVAGIEARSPNRAVTVRAQASLNDDNGVGVLVHVIDPVDSLRNVPGDFWAANPIDRLEVLLRENRIPIGIVTDGRWWGLVSAREGAMVASGIVDALTWIEEPRTRDAFLTLIGRTYLIGGDPNDRLPVLFGESVAAAEEITEALGAQVRRAVELLIQSFSESAADAKRRSLPDPLPTHPHDSYEAAVTVMMRIVFLLFAEERGLLPAGELFDQGYGIAGELEQLVARESEESEEALDATSLTWHRLLATSNALYRGATFENLRMPAYGGSLFDPTRFPFLTETTELGTLGVTVSDRVMLHVMRSVQMADIKGEARRISFREVDVEQIGYMYEGLLGYTATVADEVIVGIKGTLGEEPELPLAKLEELAIASPDRKKLAATIRKWVEEDQPSAKPPSEAAIVKAIGAEIDASIVSALTQAVGDDFTLRERIFPWLGVVRLDLRNRPFVVLSGGLLVKETPSRKNAGAHYTPKSLAEDVVVHALEPQCYAPGPYQTADRAQWKLKASNEILDLKVADIACGSGAFLVAAARFLAERVVEAWTVEDPANVTRKDLYNLAMRQVVANCLYGADINDMAIEMCKLSLWLVSLDRDLPFSFVDDKVFLGNSLLGLTDLKQLRALHINPARSNGNQLLDVFDFDVDSIINKAVALRENLASPVDDADPARSSAAKRRQLAQLREATGDLRKIADGIVAAGLSLGGKPGKPLDSAYEALREATRKAYPGSRGGPGGSTWLEAIIDHGLTPTVETDYVRWLPLHWIIEAADVMVDHDGFDAVIGNPPFLGGIKISGAMGGNVRDWLSSVVSGAASSGGRADLVAYFFLRATSLLQRSGTLGLIATNTVAQGDTREVGLDAIVAGGFTITRAIRSRSWPASGANLEYAAVWGTLARLPDSVSRDADGAKVRSISTLLEPTGRVEGRPLRLAENRDLSFEGMKPYGQGFLLDFTEAQEWIAADARNAEVLFPYLNGEDLNSRPDSSASRWAIDFNDWPEERAANYSGPFARIAEVVKPERSLKAKAVRDAPWWQFFRTRPALRKAMADLSEVLVIALVSKSVMPMRVPTGQVFSHALGVFASDSYSVQAVLSSSLHQLWAITYGSGMRNDPRYTPSDVFETFPRPEPTGDMEEIGRVLDRDRREVMLRRDLGLTKFYNLVNDADPANARDPDVSRIRELHVELDRAVLDAYGWSDLSPGHGFHTFRNMQRWTLSTKVRVEILDRLLEENHRRAENQSSIVGRAPSYSEEADLSDTLFS